ncbi:hypothetical protein [Rheinheimera sp.]|uniref:hypothetical protein n=1 Tax=Rheinheimera sp. TaxID=1869214 RepID=UPI0027BA8072|nr:hypothetical protein [Rheinheimera sp.]
MTIPNNKPDAEKADNKSQAAEPAVQSDALSEQLEAWYQQSSAQHQMPAVAKRRLLQQLKTQPKPHFSVLLLRFIRWFSWPKLQAVTAVFALGLGWHLWQQQQLSYQISQTDLLIPVQIHQLSTETATISSVPARVSRQQLFSQSYQDYIKSVELGAAVKQQVLARQAAAGGWQLDLCQQLQLQLTEGWLQEFKQQQQWSEPEWTLLATSRYLEVSTGANGQIIALKATAQPPSCAP